MSTKSGRAPSGHISAVEAILGVSDVSKRSMVWSYGLALLIAAIAVAIMAMRPTELANSAFLVTGCAVVLQIVVNGELGPGLLVAAVTIAAAEYFLVPLQGHPALSGRTDIVRLLMVSVGYIVGVVVGAQLQRTRRSSQRQRRIMERLVETGVAPVVVVSRTSEVVFANDLAQRLFGLTRSPAGGIGFVVPRVEVYDVQGQQLAADEWAITRALREGKPQFGQRRRVKHADGSVRTYVVNASPIHGEDGAVSGVVATLVDVTEQEDKAEALRKSSELWERVSEAMPGTFFRFRVAADGSYSFDYLSSNFDSTIGEPAVRGRSDFSAVWQSIHPDDAARVATGVDLAVRQRKPWTDEWRITLADGSLRWMRGSSRPAAAEPDGSQVWNGVFFDITQEKELEQRLLQAQKMESIGRLAGGIAHDFNNILTAIRGHADLALDTVDSASPARDDLQEVRRSADRAAALTRQLLAFSRKQQLAMSEFSLSGLIHDLEKMLRRVIGEDITLTVVTHGSPDTVRADRSQVEQVVMNLIVNARDAMPHGGQIELRTAAVALAMDEASALDVAPGAYLELAVRDTGTGMDDGTRARIFEPFFTTKSAGEGTGLGLAMVYGIVRQSGGAVAVDSALGKGSTFRILLPQFDATLAAEVPSTSSDRASAAYRVRVLLVEDEAMVRTLVARMLDDAGCIVTAHASGDDALAWTRVHGVHFEVLVTDVVMPGIDGPELAKRLAKEQPSLRVVFMSGYSAATPDVFELPGVPVVRLAKPFSRDALLASVLDPALTGHGMNT